MKEKRGEKKKKFVLKIESSNSINDCNIDRTIGGKRRKWIDRTRDNGNGAKGKVETIRRFIEERAKDSGGVESSRCAIKRKFTGSARGKSIRGGLCTGLLQLVRAVNDA